MSQETEHYLHCPAAVRVHPVINEKALPVAVEPITRYAGENKNNFERVVTDGSTDFT